MELVFKLENAPDESLASRTTSQQTDTEICQK